MTQSMERAASLVQKVQNIERLLSTEFEQLKDLVPVALVTVALTREFEWRRARIAIHLCWLQAIQALIAEE